MSAESPAARPADPGRSGPGGGILRPVYDAMLGKGIRGGRLRLDGLGGALRVAALVGLLALFVAMAGLLFGDLWRRGSLLYLQRLGDRVVFLPRGLLPAVTAGMFLAWALVAWGAAHAALWVRLAVAAAFLGLNAPMADPPLTSLSRDPSAFPGILVSAGYWGVPAVLVALALIRPFPRVERLMRPPALVLLLVGCGAFFGGHLAALPLQQAAQLPSLYPTGLFSAASSAQYLVVPLLGMSAVALIVFVHDVSEAAVIPLGVLSAFAVKLIVTGLVLVKLAVELGRHAGEWAAFVAERPVTTITTIVLLALFVWVFVVLRRVSGARDAAAGAREPLLLGTAVALAVPTLILLVLKMVADFATQRLGWLDANVLLRPFSSGLLLSIVDVAVWAGAVGLGLWWSRRGRPGTIRREAGLGLLVVGGWALAIFVLELFNVSVHFNERFADLVVTSVVLVVLLAGWRRLDAAAATRLGFVALFAWLVATKGQFLLSIGKLFALFGSTLGFPAAALVVFGVVLTLLADSAFARGDSPRFPRVSRPLLWLGYLLLSLAIANLVAASHAEDVTAGQADRAWFYIGVPMAVWLVARLSPARARELPAEGVPT